MGKRRKSTEIARAQPADYVGLVGEMAHDRMHRFEHTMAARRRPELKQLFAVSRQTWWILAQSAVIVLVWEFAGWVLDTVERQLVSAEGVVTPLAGAEYRLLRIFLSHPNRVLNRDQLVDLTQGREADPLDRSIDVQVGRLRHRLRDDPRDPRQEADRPDQGRAGRADRGR